MEATEDEVTRQKKYFNFVVGGKEFRQVSSTLVKEIKVLNDFISFVEEQEESGDEESEEAESIEIDDLFPDKTAYQENQRNFEKIISLLNTPASISYILYSYSIKELLSLLKCVHKFNIEKIVKKCVKVCASYIENRGEIDQELYEFVESIPDLIPLLCERIQVLSIDMPLLNISRSPDSLCSYHVARIVCDNFSRRVALVGNKKVYIIKSEPKKVEVLPLPLPSDGKTNQKIFDLKFTSDGQLNMILNNKIYSYAECQKKGWKIKKDLWFCIKNCAVSDFRKIIVYRSEGNNVRISIAEETSESSCKQSLDIVLRTINQRWAPTKIFDGCSTMILNSDSSKVAFGYASLGRVELFDIINMAESACYDIPEVKNKSLLLAFNQDASLLGVKVKTSQEEIVYCANLALNSKIKQIYKKDCDVDYEERCNSIKFAPDNSLYVMLSNKNNKKSLVRFSNLATAKLKRFVIRQGDIDCFDISSEGLLAIGRYGRKNNLELYQLAPSCLKEDKFSLEPHQLQSILANERAKFMNPANKKEHN